MASLQKKNRKKGKYFYIHDRINGKQINISVGYISKREADKMLKQYELDKARGKFGMQERQEVHLKKLMKKFLDFSEVERATATYVSHNGSCELHLFPLLGDIPIADITTEMIDEYKQERISEGAKTRTVNIELACLSIMMTKALEWGWLDRKTKFKKLKDRDRREPRYLLEEDCEKLVDECEGWQRAAVMLGWQAGLRKGEICGLKWTDIDFQNQQLNVRSSTSKSGRTRIVNMTDLLFKELKEYRQEKQGEHLFYTKTGNIRSCFKGALKWACKRAGIEPPIWPHVLRHSFAAQSLMSGMDIKTLQVILGHKDIRVTLDIYGHISPGYQKAAIKKLPFGKVKEEAEVEYPDCKAAIEKLPWGKMKNGDEIAESNQKAINF